jgi:hypothetical protein
MSFLYDDDDDDDFDLSTQLNTLEEIISNKSVEKINIRTEKMNKLRLEEENIKAIYETQLREIEERMYVLINTKDEDLISEEFNFELNQLENQFNKKFGRKQKKDRRALALGLRVGDRIKFSLNDCNEWWCECIGLENKGLFGLLKSDVQQGEQFKSLNKIYQLFMETNGMKKRAIYRSKHVEWFRDGNSLGCFV